MSGIDTLAPGHQVVEQALALPGDDQRIVLVHDGSEAEVRFANNRSTSNGTRRWRRVAVISLRPEGTGAAFAMASRSGAPDLGDLLEAARADAAGAPPAADASPLIVADADADPGFDEPAVLSGGDVLDPVLRDLGDACGAARGRRQVLAGFAEHAVTTIWLGSSTGMRRRFVQPTGRLQVVARTADGTASAWAGSGTADFTDVSLPAVVQQLQQRLTWASRRVELPPGRYDTVLPGDAVADLLCPLGEALSGVDAEEGRSVFSAPGGGTRLGEQLSPHALQLRSDPDAAGLACSPFLATATSGRDVSVFDNGMSLDPVAWISDGQLRRLRYHRAAARRFDQPTACGADNLVLTLPGATARVEDLVAEVERGLLLTCLWYIREVDPVTLLLTGLTRDGVYLVEHGEVVGAVNNFRFNESPVDLLRRASAVGASDRALSREWNEWFPRTAMPPLRVPDFNMSSVSPAT